MTTTTTQHLATYIRQRGSEPATLLPVLSSSSFLIEPELIPHQDGRVRVRFSAYAPKGAILKHRTMLPVHAAMTRVIELAGGRIKLHQPPSATTYQLRLQLDGIGLTNLTRILFDAGRSRDLIEVKASDYHDITPANWVLRIGPDRNDVIAAIDARDSELAGHLKALFDLADALHGAELKTTR